MDPADPKQHKTSFSRYSNHRFVAKSIVDTTQISRRYLCVSKSRSTYFRRRKLYQTTRMRTDFTKDQFTRSFDTVPEAFELLQRSEENIGRASLELAVGDARKLK